MTTNPVGAPGFDSPAGHPCCWSRRAKLPPTSGDGRASGRQQAAEGSAFSVRFRDRSWVASYRRDSMSTSEHALACEYATLDSVCEAEAEVVLVEAGSGFTGGKDAAKNVYCRPHADELLDDDRLDWQETDEDPVEVRA